MPPTFISEVVDGVPNVTSTLLPAARVSEPADSWLPDDNARCPPLLTLTEPSAEPVPVRVPPLLTLTCALASEPLRPTVPPLIAVLPVKVLLLANVKSDKPFLVRPPAPSMMPFKLKSLLPATVNPAFSVMSLPMPSEALLSSVAALPTIRLPLPRPLAEPSVSVPSLSVVPPLKLLLPLRVRLAAPFLVKPPLPLTMPPRLTLALLPMFRLPPSETALVSVTEVLASRVVPSAALSAPVPSAVLLPTNNVPALRAVLPELLLLPVRVKLAVPLLVMPPVPLNSPTRVRALLPSTLSAPVMLMLLANVTLVVLSRVVPAAVFSAPLPSELLLVTSRLPALRVVVPLKPVLAPLTVRLPVPVLIRPLLALIKPPSVSAPVPLAVKVPPRLIALARLMVPGALNVVALVTLRVPVLNA